VGELSAERPDAFRSGRSLKAVTAAKELEILRLFLGICLDRSWTRENAALKIKAPRNIRPNEVVPFTPAGVMAIIDACQSFG